MNIQRSTLSNALNLCVYNGNSMDLARKDKPNIYMGIGLWSKQQGLSQGLPVDVIHMLLTATLAKVQIKAETGLDSKIIILIADSMAVREGADQEAVSELVKLYKKSLKPLIERLKIKDSTELIMSSDFENSSEYLQSEKLVESAPLMQHLQKIDPEHSAYVQAQTTITHCMSASKHVGTKVGWIPSESCKELHRPTSGTELKIWDELKFDRIYDEICKESPVKCLYTKAGLKHSFGKNHEVGVREGCPYTAFDKDKPYIICTDGEKKVLKSVLPKVVSQWKSVPEICLNLIRENLAEKELLLEERVNQKNLKVTVANMLEDWMNMMLK